MSAFYIFLYPQSQDTPALFLNELTNVFFSFVPNGLLFFIKYITAVFLCDVTL